MNTGLKCVLERKHLVDLFSWPYVCSDILASSIQTVCCIKVKAYKNIFKQDGLFGQVCVRIKQLQIHTILPINTCSCDLMTSQFHIVQVRVFLGVGGSEEFISPP